MWEPHLNSFVSWLRGWIVGWNMKMGIELFWVVSSLKSYLYSFHRGCLFSLIAAF